MGPVHGQQGEEHPEADLGPELGPLVQSQAPAVADLDPVIGEPDERRADQGQHDQRPRSGEGHPGHGMGGEVADDHGGHDADPAHGGRAGLGDVDLGPVLPDLLADVVLDQPPDQDRGRQHRHPQGHTARGHQGDHRAAPPVCRGVRTRRRSARACRAWARSSKGTGPPASTWDGLVALAGDDHHVPGLGHPDGQPDGLGPVRLDHRLRPGVHAGPDLLDDGRRVLRAGVVRGQHGDVRPAGGHGPHLRPLPLVPVSTAPEHADHPTRTGATRSTRSRAADRAASSPAGVWA